MSESPIDQISNTSESSNHMQELRWRIQKYILLAISVLGIFYIFFNGRALIQQGSWGMMIIMVMVYLYMVFLTLMKERIPYRIKAVSINVLFLGMALLSYYRYGLAGDGRIWLMFFVLYSTIFYSLRGSIIAGIVSVITHIIAAFLIGQNRIPTSPAYNYNAPMSVWFGTGITFTLVVAILAFSIAILLRDLDQKLIDQSSTTVNKGLLGQNLSEERQEIKEDTQQLEKRLKQIRSAADITRNLGTILDPQALLDYVTEQIKNSFDLYYVGAFIVDEWNRYAHLTAGTGEAGQKMLADGHKLSIGGSSMVGWSTAHRQPRISLDVGEEAIRFTNPHLPLTRSELALPLVIGDQVLGALSVQSTEVNAFDPDAITTLQGIADNLAINLHNARMFQQLEGNLQEIQQLNREYLSEAWRDVDMEGQGISIEVESENPPGESESAQTLNVPLTLREDQVIGNILLEATRDNWSPEEMEFIEAISNQAALALESARLLEETQRRVEREQTISRMTTQFARTLDFDTLIQMIVRELGKLPKVVEASIHIAPPDGLIKGDEVAPTNN